MRKPSPKERWRAQRSRERYESWRSRQDRLDARKVRVSLGEAQAMVFWHPARFRILVAGRRFGKTWLAVICLVLAALLKRGALCWYVAPTREMARDIAWEALKSVLRLLPASYVVAIAESRLTVRFRNGSMIQLKSAHNPDSLRGRALDFLVVDECADRRIKKELWEEVLKPALSDRQGRALLISTPKGFNWFYFEYIEGLAGTWLDDDGPTSIASFSFTSLDGGRIPAAEIEARRAEMDPRSFRQEYLASFEALGNRVYDSFNRAENVKAWVRPRIQELLARGHQVLLVGFDFNVNPMTAVVAVKDGDRCLVAACLQPMTSNTHELAVEVIRQWGDPNPETKKPRRKLIAHPDASGSHRDTRSGITDHQLLTNAGFLVDAPPANPEVVDRVNAVNAMLCDAAGTRRLFLDPTAAALILSLDGQVWKTDSSGGTLRIPDKSAGLDHANDALGYLIFQSFNLLSPQWRQAHVKW